MGGGGTFPSPIFFDNWKGGSPLVSPFANRVKVDSVKLIIGEFSSSFPVQFTCSYCFCNSSSEYFRVALSWLGHFLPFEASQSSPCDILLSRKEGDNVVWRSRLCGVSVEEGNPINALPMQNWKLKGLKSHQVEFSLQPAEETTGIIVHGLYTYQGLYFCVPSFSWDVEPR